MLVIDFFSPMLTLNWSPSPLSHPFYQSTLFVYKIKHPTLLITSDFTNLRAYNGVCYDTYCTVFMESLKNSNEMDMFYMYVIPGFSIADESQILWCVILSLFSKT